MQWALWLLVVLWSVPAVATGVRVELCYNYGCNAHGEVVIEDVALEVIGQRLRAAHDAPAEREVLAAVIGALYRVAGEQTPVGADRAGNYGDDAVDGRMDCIDHSTNTTRFLRLLEVHGLLRFHRTLAPARRSRFFITQHFSAVIEEVEPAASPLPEPVADDRAPAFFAACDCVETEVDVPVAEVMPSSRAGERYAVDSWFVDNGEAAIVLPLADWMDGGGPNVR